MKPIHFLSTYLILIGIIISCKTQDMVKLDFLVGTWKMEDKETYEVWEKEGNTFKGHVYKLIKGEKHITETLEIKFIEGNIIYSPTVPDQNDGKAIPFRHNRSIKDLISFENKAHDFPKKIQYKVISDTRIHISVLGEDEEGFSYYMVKQ